MLFVVLSFWCRHKPNLLRIRALALHNEPDVFLNTSIFISNWLSCCVGMCSRYSMLSIKTNITVKSRGTHKRTSLRNLSFRFVNIAPLCGIASPRPQRAEENVYITLLVGLLLRSLGTYALMDVFHQLVMCVRECVCLCLRVRNGVHLSKHTTQTCFRKFYKQHTHPLCISHAMSATTLSGFFCVRSCDTASAAVQTGLDAIAFCTGPLNILNNSFASP